MLIVRKVITMIKGMSEPLILHPVLSKYLLKLDFNNQPDHDHGLPEEEICCSATHPPLPSLVLENRQGYPLPIVVQASGDSPDIGVTVRDVLRTIHEDGSKRLEAEERTTLDAAFEKRCKTKRELSQGPRRIDYLGSRDRLVIVPKHLLEGEMVPALPAGSVSVV
jgi:hypothetical protein